MLNNEDNFIDECKRAKKTGLNGKGDPVYGTPFAFMARVEKYTDLVRNSQGKMIATKYRLATKEPIDLDDNIWFPSLYGEPIADSTDPEQAQTPVSVAAARTLDGDDYLIVVYF